jgi:cyclic pyranopterin phosphate synthase
VPEPLLDTFGRVHRDLRISVTDRCDLRCTYCMPADGLPWVPREEILTFGEITRLARIAVERYGVDAIRLTGGEPTVRHDLVSLVRMLAELDVDLSMTTNGMSLGRLAVPLREAGLRRVNISLDTLRADRFLEITRRDGLAKVLDGVAAAVEAGFDPVKLNVVCMDGVNDDEVVDLVAFGREAGVEVRFIEFMPLDADHEWSRVRVLPGEEIVRRVQEAFPLVAVGRGSDPAELWEHADGRGRIGVIPTVTEPFCATCDRVRLTAEGRMRACLFSIDETDLRPLLRGGASDDDVAAAMAACVAGKWAGHQVGSTTFVAPPRSMSQIGG